MKYGCFRFEAAVELVLIYIEHKGDDRIWCELKAPQPAYFQSAG